MMMMIKVEDLDNVFADVTPIPQNDGPHPVCVIDYKDDFVKAYDLMRAILKANEQSGTSLMMVLNTLYYALVVCLISHAFASLYLLYDLDRALELSALCLQFNPANYTVWHFRRRCLLALNDEKLSPQVLEQDLELAASLGGSNPKNYQIWYHRRALLEACGLEEDLAGKELEYVATVLTEDAKNYHVSVGIQ